MNLLHIVALVLSNDPAVRRVEIGQHIGKLIASMTADDKVKNPARVAEFIREARAMPLSTFLDHASRLFARRQDTELAHGFNTLAASVKTHGVTWADVPETT